MGLLDRDRLYYLRIFDGGFMRVEVQHYTLHSIVTVDRWCNFYFVGPLHEQKANKNKQECIRRCTEIVKNEKQRRKDNCIRH